jgi:DHA3 family macrolide efflux protein-like MFS transporter
MIDQLDKRKLLIYTCILKIFAVVFMLIAVELNSIWWMTLYIILIGISNVFFRPMIQALIPILIKEDHLVQANGVIMNVITTARIVGTALAGVLLVSFSLISLYVFELVAYLFLMIFMFYLKVDSSSSTAENDPKEKVIEKDADKNTSKRFNEVFSIIRKKPMVFDMLALMGIPYFFLSGFNLMVIEISKMHADPLIKGLIYPIEGVCSLIGALMIKNFVKKGNYAPVLLILSLLIALSQLSLFFANIKWVVFVSFAIFGLGIGSFIPLLASFFQKEIPRSTHGRFFSFKMTMETTMFLLLMMVTGLFLDAIGFYKTVLVMGSASFSVFIIMTLRYFKSSSEYHNESYVSDGKGS